MTKLIFIIFAGLSFSHSVLALGSRNPATAEPEASDRNYTVEIPLQKSEGYNFDSRYKADFNGDGFKDRLHCDSKNKVVFVRNAKNLKQNLMYWKGPQVKKLPNGSNRIFTGCEVIYLKPGRPSILVSTAYAHPVNGVRVPSEQFLLHNRGHHFSVQHLKASLNGKTYTYKTASRSVKCAPYPRPLVQKGYHPGVLCFFAGYDSPTPHGYGTTAALIKIEERQNGSVVGKDLTASSGLIWKGGILGTPMGHFSTYKSSSGSRKYNGLHMMGSAFLDFSGDGLVDFVTVGQHSSIRAHKSFIDTKRSEGLGFSTSEILKARAGNMTEFLSITGFGEYDKKIVRPCVFITGEQFDGNYGSSSKVHDHIRCYQRNSKKWSLRHDLPVKNLSSEYTTPVIRKMPNGRVWIRVAQKKRENGKTVFFRHRLFRAR